MWCLQQERWQRWSWSGSVEPVAEESKVMAAWELRKSPMKAQPRVPDWNGKDKRDLRFVLRNVPLLLSLSLLWSIVVVDGRTKPCEQKILYGENEWGKYGRSLRQWKNSVHSTTSRRLVSLSVRSLKTEISDPDLVYEHAWKLIEKRKKDGPVDRWY